MITNKTKRIILSIMILFLLFLIKCSYCMASTQDVKYKYENKHIASTTNINKNN